VRGEEIPIQTRMMTISDIFDALTASDRPYKRAVPVDRALDIMSTEVEAGMLDSELFALFREAKVYERTADGK
jgi:HD-GYP domain-containing protein (c-di-GMP phosphodiesterase class II)